MAKIKLTKSAVDAAQLQDKAIELRDTVVPDFLCKITPTGRKVFMLQYRTNAGERRKPALGQYGELTVDQARTMAQEWRRCWSRVRWPAKPEDTVTPSDAIKDPYVLEFLDLKDEYSESNLEAALIRRLKTSCWSWVKASLSAGGNVGCASTRPGIESICCSSIASCAAWSSST